MKCKYYQLNLVEREFPSLNSTEISAIRIESIFHSSTPELTDLNGQNITVNCVFMCYDCHAQFRLIESYQIMLNQCALTLTQMSNRRKLQIILIMRKHLNKLAYVSSKRKPFILKLIIYSFSSS
jgi:hypothetical protein